MKPLAIILVTHNRLDYTRQTIDSLQKTVPHAKLIVWDNASTEAGMLEYLREGVRAQFPTMILTESSENVGWAYAVNASMEYVTKGYDWVLLSNNDAVYHQQWFEKSLALYEEYPKIGILGLWKHTAHGVIPNPFITPGLVVKDQMPAVGWLMLKGVMQRIGSLSQHGPCETKGGNGEDVDYCIRARQLGYWVAGPEEDFIQHIDGY